MRKATAGALIVVALATLFVLWRRYTAYGIFLGDGAQYWVTKAVATTDDSQARNHLRRVVEATQYGVNAAENAVAKLPRRQQRMRMWRLLIEVAPNENWREIYRGRLTRGRAMRFHGLS